MTGFANTTLLALMHEFAVPLGDASGCTITVDERTVNGALEVTYRAELKLAAALPIRLEPLALQHARDPAAYIDQLVGQQIRPFGQKLNRAAAASASAWEAVTDGR